MASQTVPYVTPEEYLEAEREAVEKSEYYNGCVYPRATRSPRAVGIATNLIAALGSALKSGPCQVFNPDMRVHVPATGLYTYPDVSVVCGAPAFVQADNLVNPTVIVEVFANFFDYQSIPTLKEYLLVSQNPRGITHCTRLGNEDWRIETIGDEKDSLRLSSIGVELTFDQIYAGVESLPG